MSRSRVSSDRVTAIANGGTGTLGAQAAGSWLSSRGGQLQVERWHFELALDVVQQRASSEFDEATASRFQLDIYSDEWGVYVCHAGQASRIRVTNIALTHGRDDFRLLGVTPQLKDIGWLLHHLESRLDLAFQREHAYVGTNLPAIEPAVRAWLLRL